MCSLVTHTVQINPSIHIYLISDKIVLMCVKTHDSRIIRYANVRTSARFMYHQEEHVAEYGVCEMNH